MDVHEPVIDAESDANRKQREATFHDARHNGNGDPRVVTRPFYRITTESHGYYRNAIYQGCAGLHVLEYGCGPGSESFALAERGAIVEGIDISANAIQLATQQAAAQGLDNISFSVMDAEHTTFPDRCFDLIVGTGILHHLDLSGAYAEIGRLLTPAGRAVFVEPLGHNPLINAYRRRTPELRTADEHPLLTRDLASARQRFAEVSVRYFHLATLAAIGASKSALFEPTLCALAAIDRAIFQVVPGSRKYAWMCVIELSATR